MNALVTGSSGFLGRKIVLEFQRRKINVVTLGRNIENDIFFDLRSSWTSQTSSVDLVVHCAGKAHSIPKTKSENQEFHDLNLKGTNNLLNGFNDCFPRSFIFISSVAVYGKESGNLIHEECPLLAKDPYGLSKIYAEDLVRNWCAKHGVVCTILRLPLIIGSGAPGNLHAMIAAIKKGYYFNIDGGLARKSMVLAKDIAQILPLVAKFGGIYNLTDRHHPSFHDLAVLISGQLGKPVPFSIPGWTANLLARVGDFAGSRWPIDTNKLKKITSDLTFDDRRAVDAFGWDPTSVLNGFEI